MTAKEKTNTGGTPQSELNWLLEKVLTLRGIEEGRQAFLAPEYELHTHNPFLFSAMRPAIERVRNALANKERVAIFCDYDCDGISSGAIMYDFLQKIGFVDVDVHIPHRHFDGYGLSMDAIDALIHKGVTLILALDCGISNIAEVAHAKDRGCDVVILDHHEPKAEGVPDAYAILNPKCDATYPFRDICAATVVYKFVQAYMQDLREKDPEHAPALGWEKWLLDLVAIATVSDMMPLIDENRALLTFGLRVLRQTRRPGIRMLAERARIALERITEEDIGFTIAPRINAASRMDSPEHAFALFTAKSRSEAERAVDTLERLNAERKGVVAAMSKEAFKKCAHSAHEDGVIVVGDARWRPSLVGLVAHSILERYRRPVFIWGRDGNGNIKGSCRSDSVSVVLLMESAKDAFSAYGGHTAAGGFEVHEAHIHTVQGKLSEAYTALLHEGIEKNDPTADIICTISAVGESEIRALRQLAPFGMGNEKPTFRFESVTVRQVGVFGKTKEHTKIEFAEDGIIKTAIAFFKKPEQFTSEPQKGGVCTLIGTVEESYYMGKYECRLRLLDVVG